MLNSCIAKRRLWEYWGQSCQLTSWFQRLITQLIKDWTQLRWLGKGCNNPRKGWVNHAVVSLVGMGRWVVRTDTAFSSSWEGAACNPPPFLQPCTQGLEYSVYLASPSNWGIHCRTAFKWTNCYVMFPKTALLPSMKQDRAGWDLE